MYSKQKKLKKNIVLKFKTIFLYIYPRSSSTELSNKLICFRLANDMHNTTIINIFNSGVRNIDIILCLQFHKHNCLKILADISRCIHVKNQ